MAVSIFHRRWWLDAATDGAWVMVESASHGGVVGRLPVHIRRFLGQQKICMPPWTRTLGPVLSDGEGKAATLLRARLAVMEDLIERLPPHLAFEQTFDPGSTNLLAFALKGFDLGVQYTFRLKDCSDVEGIWRGMRDKTRNTIRRAGERFDLGVGLPATDFASFYFANLDRRGIQPMGPRRSLEAVMCAAARHDAGTVLYCTDRNGDLAAAVLTVWDETCAYFLVSSRDEQRADNGSVSLLLWEAIRLAGRKGLMFDFDSFADRGGALFVSQFGGSLIPRWTVSRIPVALRVKRRLQNTLGTWARCAIPRRRLLGWR